MPATMNVLNSVFTCAKSAITGAGITVNESGTVQYSWSAPSFPAWNAAKELYASALLLIGVNTPPIPGTPPYTNYEYDPWGNDRNTIGAVWMGGQVAIPCYVQFTNESSGNPDYHTWWFGDESPVSHDENPQHEYASEGDYDATHRADRGAVQGTPCTKTVHAFNNRPM